MTTLRATSKKGSRRNASHEIRRLGIRLVLAACTERAHLFFRPGVKLPALADSVAFGFQIPGRAYARVELRNTHLFVNHGLFAGPEVGRRRIYPCLAGPPWGLGTNTPLTFK